MRLLINALRPSLNLGKRSSLRSHVALVLLLLILCALTFTSCQRVPAQVVPSPVVVTDQSWATLRDGGQPWQVDWETIHVNLNDEGEFIGEFGEEPGEGRFLLNTPNGITGDGPDARMDFFTWQRAYPLQTLPDNGIAIAHAQTQAMMSVPAAAELPRWENIGPAPMRNSSIGQQKIDVAGRTRAIAIDPTNGDTVYIGTAMGGVWKTTNGGNSWTPLTDQMPSLAIGALTIDPKNTQVIYAGTGEPTLGGDNYYGAGILKSTNGGNSWSLIGAERFAGMAISKIIIDPADSNTLYVSSARSAVQGAAFPSRGVFKSTDGGQSWTGLLTCEDASCIGVTDLVLTATNPLTLLAGVQGYGVAASTDGGANWQFLSNGLPDPNQFNVQRIILDASPSNPGVIYASIHLGIPNQYDGAALFKSTDGGASWTNLPIGPDRFNFCGQQCWYSHELAVHPTNPDAVLLGGMAVYVDNGVSLEKVHRIIVRLSGNGQTLTDLTPNTASNNTLHPDMHVIAFDPSDPQTVWAGNDGGVFKSTDGGTTWQTRNEGLATLQFTGFAVHPSNDNIVQGGMQDNNKAFTTTGGGSDGAWTATDVGDGGFALIDPFDPTIWYGTRFGISFQRNAQGPGYLGYWDYFTNGINNRDNALFYIPITADTGTQGVFYLGTDKVYRTANRGDSWSAISPILGGSQGSVSTIAVAPSDPQTVWAGTSDGNIAVTRNGGGNWSSVAAALPGRYVSEIAVQPGSPQTAYVVYNGFNTHTPNTPGHVFKTTDGGANWQDISSNLPDVPALSIVVHRTKPGFLYLGTDTGVFMSENDGASWLPFNNNMPNVSVVDLAFNGRGNILYAATHGRSVLRVVLEESAVVGGQNIFLPMVANRASNNVPTPTSPPTATPTPSPTLPPTNTPTTTPTKVTPEGTPLPTQAATATLQPSATPLPTKAGPTPEPTATPNVNQFRDGFGDSNSGWGSGNNGTCASGYVDLDSNGSTDTYVVQAITFDRICIASAPEAAPANGSYAVTAFKDGPDDDSVYGLVFGLNNPNIDGNSEFYIFYIDPFDQTFALYRYTPGGGGVYLTGDNSNAFVFDAAINSDGNANRLRVRREGDRIDLFVNERYLDTVVDSTLLGNNYAGFATWYAYDESDGAASGFDDFTMHAVGTVYQESYADVSSGWAVGDIEICQAAYGGGEYRTASQADYFCWFTAPGDAQPNGRFRATMRREDGFYQMAYGVIAGYNYNETSDEVSFYALLVIPDTQSYALAKYSSTAGWLGITWDEVADTPWLYANVISAGNFENELELERDGDLLRIFINGTALGGYIDFEPLPGGYFGLINWASQFEEALADYDNYRVVTWDDGGFRGQGQAISRPPASPGDSVPAVTGDLQGIERLEGVERVE